MTQNNAQQHNEINHRAINHRDKYTAIHFYDDCFVGDSDVENHYYLKFSSAQEFGVPRNWAVRDSAYAVPCFKAGRITCDALTGDLATYDVDLSHDPCGTLSETFAKRMKLRANQQRIYLVRGNFVGNDARGYHMIQHPQVILFLNKTKYAKYVPPKFWLARRAVKDVDL